MTDQTQQSIRLRVVEFVIQPVIMADDGDSLTPSPCQPVTVPAREMADFHAHFTEHLVAEEARMNGTPA